MGEAIVGEDDHQFVQGCLAGEAGAFEALYQAHAGRVLTYFLRSGFARNDADDLTQDVFVRAYRSLSTFDGHRGGLRVWLGAIARNVARRQWQRRVEPENFDPTLAEECLPAREDASSAPEAAEEVSAVRAFVEELPGELKEIIRLRYVEGRTTRGIEAVTGVPESTVRMRLKEAVAMLESWMRARGFPGRT